jgi:hypothetical protein
MSPDEWLDSEEEEDAHDAPAESFVLRLWVEDATDPRGSQWRGHITHVVTHERRYVRGLDDVGLFVMPYLERMGVRFGWCWRARRWLSR